MKPMTRDSRRRTPATFVLVHGASHGGWCWRRVSDLLTANGHRVFAPTLTGLCERSHLMNDETDLTTHINDIVNEIKWKDLDKVVLVGHSYGGMVITGVAEQLVSRIASIVYLDAFLPGDGQSLLDVVNMYAPGWTPPPPPFSGADFAAFLEVNDNDLAWVGSKLTPQPPGTMTEKLRVSGAFLKVPRRASKPKRARRIRIAAVPSSKGWPFGSSTEGTTRHGSTGCSRALRRRSSRTSTRRSPQRSPRSRIA